MKLMRSRTARELFMLGLGDIGIRTSMRLVLTADSLWSIAEVGGIGTAEVFCQPLQQLRKIESYCDTICLRSESPKDRARRSVGNNHVLKFSSQEECDRWKEGSCRPSNGSTWESKRRSRHGPPGRRHPGPAERELSVAGSGGGLQPSTRLRPIGPPDTSRLDWVRCRDRCARRASARSGSEPLAVQRDSRPYRGPRWPVATQVTMVR